MANSNDAKNTNPAVTEETPAGSAAVKEDANVMVDLFVLPDHSDENPNCVIGINGKNWVMPRGETSRVPKFVADEYNRAMQAQIKMDRTVAARRGIKNINTVYEQ